ncbi:MAG: vWA domain-containing protein, partial [Parachlamydiaceae bacterium]
GSMAEPMYSGRAQSVQSKLSISREALSRFSDLRKNDLIGLAAFARKTDIISPPTLDHQAVLDALNTISIVKGQEEDGTAIGYAIYKTATLIQNLKEASKKLEEKAPYEIKGAGIVLVTDGLQDPNPLDKDNPTRSIELVEAARYAKEHDIKLYVLNVEPRLNQEKYLPNLNEMKRIAEMTKGAFYLIERPSQVADIMEAINSLEASEILMPLNPFEMPTLYEKVSYAYPFFLIAFCLLFLLIILRLTYLRVSP